MDSLIKVEFSGEIFDKLAKIIGKTPMKEAIDSYIEDIKKSDMDPLVKSAQIRQARTSIKEFVNQNDIMQYACQNIKADANPNNVDIDWMNQFFDKAGLVSSTEFQIIWGRILARECNEPGSIPRVLLHILEQMDSEDAKDFMAICRLSISINNLYNPVISRGKFDEELELVGLNLDKLVSLNALGLIQMDLDLMGSYEMGANGPNDKVVYFDKVYEITGKTKINVGNVIFTKSGQALCQSIEVEPVEGFWENYCLPYWAKFEKENE